MKLVSILFDIEKDKQAWVFSDLKKMLESLEKAGYRVSLYRDNVDANRFLLHYFSEKPEEELVDLLQNDPGVKSFFEKLKEVSEQVEVSSHEKIF